jgi:hypothetical protein
VNGKDLDRKEVLVSPTFMRYEGRRGGGPCVMDKSILEPLPKSTRIRQPANQSGLILVIVVRSAYFPVYFDAHMPSSHSFSHFL